MSRSAAIKIDRDGQIIVIAQQIVNASQRIRELKQRTNWRECEEVETFNQCEPCPFWSDATPEGPETDPDRWCPRCQSNKITHDEAKAWRAKRSGLLRRLESAVNRRTK